MSVPLRVLLADDEAMARQRLERLLKTFPEVELVRSCQSAEEVLEEVRKRIDAIDAELLRLVDERAGLAKDVLAARPGVA